jgi:hypothetical protein
VYLNTNKWTHSRGEPIRKGEAIRTLGTHRNNRTLAYISSELGIVRMSLGKYVEQTKRAGKSGVFCRN